MSTFDLKERLSGELPLNSEHRKLVAFDFDHTVVDDNTDIVVRDLVKSKITDDVTKLYKKSGWTSYMQEIFYLLHTDGFTKSQIKDAIEAIPEVAGLKLLLKNLNDTGNVDIIIISDSNSVFIKFWCDHNDVSKYIKHIYTNQAHFNDDDLLVIKPFHHQTECLLSSENLCKGKILVDFVRNQQHECNVIYDRIFYIGDGTNDICPVLRLGAQDFGLARNGYRMQKELDRKNQLLNAKLELWNNGTDLEQLIFENI